jgi:UDP-N-acetylglucosamine 2-epimerase (non-hydrolysing)
MRIVTILGTRPEIIRLSRIIPKLDRHVDHVLVHTGQNNAPTLSEIFFSELKLRAPDHYLGITEPDFARQIARIMIDCHDLLKDLRPDRVLILGDTNSALSSVVAKRLGIPVFHLEAGNRCFDERVPEEVNRRIIDHASDILLPYTERSRENLLREGFPSNRVLVVGNPIYEVLLSNAPNIEASSALETLQVAPRRYFLVTLHRAENVDIPERLTEFVEAFRSLGQEHGLPILVSTHPRTRARLQALNLQGDAQVRFLDPLGFFDFVALEKQAACVLSDSGTVQEECAILRVPSVTLRDVTERPETIECGANILTGCDVGAIRSAVNVTLGESPQWLPPAEYLTDAVSETVLRIVTGYCHALPRSIAGNNWRD